MPCIKTPMYHYARYVTIVTPSGHNTIAQVLKDQWKTSVYYYPDSVYIYSIFKIMTGFWLYIFTLNSIDIALLFLRPMPPLYTFSWQCCLSHSTRPWKFWKQLASQVENQSDAPPLVWRPVWRSKPSFGNLFSRFSLCYLLALSTWLDSAVK